MSAAQLSDTNTVERRFDRRYAKRMQVHVRERGRSGHVAELLDISASGCAVDTSGMSGNFNAPIWLRIGEVSSLQAKLVWSNGRRGGLHFDHALHQAVLERLVAANDQANAEPSAASTDKDPLVNAVGESRREQITKGYAESSLFPRKKPLRLTPLAKLIERRVERNCDHRLEDRFPAEITSGPTHVTLRDASAKVRDISASGIGLLGGSEKTIGEPVEVKFLDCEPISGRVIWRKGDRFGVQLGENAIEITTEQE
ncbi:PilZ domain-containing protein [Altererythrobacter sp. GH1-8]|uniref:PilZ domain-containing protein n=1 Tax=Altererythrobacter sp. GH1-8 TaxID=3349333 RepID=UPI00374D1EDF